MLTKEEFERLLLSKGEVEFTDDDGDCNCISVYNNGRIEVCIGLKNKNEGAYREGYSYLSVSPMKDAYQEYLRYA